ncbi:hypothetical protein PBY51_018639 [Eleginops maclovinus]|uniref:Uncharacterized protein n=1 Tax=Eleginops maclovinus TaxID=56733 RepID=A0AAN8AV23_ELEMC|nr:hypothetical protein PBY51_018639 [Eleginops maclovinus]
MALLRSERQKSSSSIFLSFLLVLFLIRPPFFSHRVWNCDGIQVTQFPSIPCNPTPSPHSPTFNLMVAWPGSGSVPGLPMATGCETDIQARLESLSPA